MSAWWEEGNGLLRVVEGEGMICYRGWRRRYFVGGGGEKWFGLGLVGGMREESWLGVAGRLE